MQTGDMFGGLDLDELFPVDHFFDSYVARLEGTSRDDFLFDRESKPVIQKSHQQQHQPQQPQLQVNMGIQQDERDMLAAESAYLQPPSGRQGFGSLAKADHMANIQSSFASNQQSFTPEIHHGNEFNRMDMGVHQVNDGFGFNNEMVDMNMDPIPLEGSTPMPGYVDSSMIANKEGRSSSKSSGGVKATGSKGTISRNRNRTVRQQALNKQAQQRYRQRKKARAVELEHTVQALTVEIDQLKAIKEEKRALEERALELERTLLEKESEIQQLKSKPQSRSGQSKSSDGSDASSTEVDRNTDAGQAQMAADFHQKVQELKDFLSHNGISSSQRVSPHSQGISGQVIKEVSKRLTEVCGICMRLVRLEGPNVWDLIQAKTNRALSFEPIGEEHWFRAARSLQLTEEQVRTANMIRQQCMDRLEKLYVERQNLNLRAIGLLLPSEQGGQAPRFGNLGCFVLGSFISRTKHSKKTHAVLEKLKANLREEQKLLSEVDYMLYHRVVNPLQGAWAVLSIYPHHCDALCLLNAIHEQYQMQTESHEASGGGSRTN